MCNTHRQSCQLCRFYSFLDEESATASPAAVEEDAGANDMWVELRVPYDHESYAHMEPHLTQRKARKYYRLHILKESHIFLQSRIPSSSRWLCSVFVFLRMKSLPLAPPSRPSSKKTAKLTTRGSNFLWRMIMSFTPIKHSLTPKFRKTTMRTFSKKVAQVTFAFFFFFLL